MTFVSAAGRSRVLFAGTHLSGFLTEAGEEYTGEAGETTVLTETAKTYIPLNSDGSASLDGLFDGTPGAIHDALKSLQGLHAPEPYSYGPRGFVLSEPVEVANLVRSSYRVNSAVAGVVSVSMAGQASGGVHSGVSLADLTSRDTTDDGSGHDDGASTDDGAVANLHVTGVSGTDPTVDVKVQHSDDGDIWVDLITFTQADDESGQHATVDGTVERHLRATWTIGGTDNPTATFAVTVARR